MVPKIYAKGSSFKGAAAYLLHDKDRADTSERVAWTEARNLAVDDPQAGWRIMAATAMDQARLKEQAGVPNTGRKSDKHVLHMSLSWHPEQRPSREDMIAAADGAIAALSAQDRQALYIAHNDEDHAHVHILLNRVSPTDGRHLSSSKEKLNLSAWAEEYERETGIYCENRIVNNAARQRGDYVRGDKDQSRHIYEAQREAAANDNESGRDAIAQQKAKDAALADKGRELAQAQREAWAALEQTHSDRKTALARQLFQEREKAKATAREEYRPQWVELNRRQDAERQTFASMEKSFFGRLASAAKLSTDMVRNQESNVIRRSFGVMRNAGDRRGYFDQAQERAQKALQRAQDDKAAQGVAKVKDAHTERLAANRTRFVSERAQLAETQAKARLALQAEWKQRTAEREAAYRLSAQKEQARQNLLDQYKQVSPAPSSPEARAERYMERQARIEEFKRASQQKTREQDNDRDRGGRER